MILKSVISFRKVGEEVFDYLKCRNKEASYSIEQVADRIGKAFNKFVISSGLFGLSGLSGLFRIMGIFRLFGSLG